ncbi:M23 family metallopeptidase [Roseovarius sp. A46]|uniref:M23 family metallopeptidase n=1 Tax=Roseovarius sp. A46 TaxID=2109331 RepID=UPI0019D6BF1D|nr:M23 family metallopeptidase [Roseovarius sp. A46]
MKPTLAIRLHEFLERHFPERRVFLRSDTDTRFIRLRPGTQIIAAVGTCAIVAWTIIATAVLVMDSIGAGNFREQAKRELQTYEARLNALAEERDRRAQEALAAQERFSSALAQISAMQSELLASETRRRELETGLEMVQGTLRRAMSAREDAQHKVARLTSQIQAGKAENPGAATSPADDPTVEVLTTALADAARERDKTLAEAEDAQRDAEEMAFELRLVNERNSEIFSRLEDAMTISVEPLETMFRKAGLDPDTLIDTVRRGYSGQGGPLTPISLSTRGTAPSPEATRANRILTRLDELNLYRLAAGKVPLAIPVKGAFRYTSGFGMRWGRLHAGTDFAGAHGAPIHATADGVVTHAGWLSGYGQLVKIKHAFGIETRYAHMSRIRVREGQRVSRGDRIGDMGNTGRSTGTHLHYEVRVDGKAINPMTYIKAARDVF